MNFRRYDGKLRFFLMFSRVRTPDPEAGNVRFYVGQGKGKSREMQC
jgi:hypothetical protein